MPALISIVMLAFSGAGLIVAGVFLLFGMGPALIAAGFFLIAASIFLRPGLSANG